MTLYQPPKLEHTLGGEGLFAIGRILLYDDLDDDGRYSTTDVMVGGAETKGLVYATTMLGAYTGGMASTTPRATTALPAQNSGVSTRPV